MPTPISLAGQDLIVVQHRWRDLRTLQGFEGDVEWKPVPYSGQALPNLIYAAGREWMKTSSWTTRPDPLTGYMAVPLPPYNDPDLTGYVGVQVSPKGEQSLTVEVPFDAPLTSVTEEMADALSQLDIPIEVTVGAQVRAVWLTDLAVTSPVPTPPSLFWTTAQTMAAILDTVDVHDQDPQAHQDLRGPRTPTGGAGGALSGNYPNPGFAVPMATQSELTNASTADRARANHTGAQPISTVTGLQSALDAKQASDSDLTAIAGLDATTPGAIASDGAGWIKKTYAQLKTALGLTKSDVGLANVDNTSDASKPVSTATQTALTSKANSNDARLSDAREWSRYSHGAGASTGQVPVWDGTQYAPGTVSGGGGGSGGSYTDEQAQDAVAALWAAGTHTGLSSNYRDVDNALDVTVTYGTTSNTAAAGNDSRLSDPRVPTDSSVTNAKVASDANIAESKLNLASDAPAGTASRRSLGTGATQATAGNDSRLSDPRVPTDGSVTDAKVASGANIAESKLALASDAVAGTASRRTLGTGSQQAAAGNDSRLSDQRVPTDSSVTDAKVATNAAIAESKLSLASDAAAGTASRRTLGTGATQAAAGNDARFTDARTPTAHTHPASDLTATGTRDATTFLRGDNTWATIAASGYNPVGRTFAQGAYTASPNDYVLADASGGAFTVTLPATGVAAVKKTDTTTNIVTVAASSGKTIGTLAAASVPLRLSDQAVITQVNGANHVITSGYQSLTALDARYAAAGQHHPTGIHVGAAVDDSVWYPGFTTGGIHGSGGSLEELVVGTSSSPDTTDTAVSWIQKFTALNQEIRYHYVSGALVETVKTGGNSAPNSLVANAAATGGKGDMTALQGRAVTDVDLGTSTGEAISTGVWAASVTPTTAAAYTSSAGLEINVFNRFGSTTKKQYLTPGTLVGALIYNYSANPSSGAADGVSRPNHFGVYLGGNVASSFHTGILIDTIINEGIRFEGSSKPVAGKAGIVFNDTYQTTGIRFTAALTNDAGTANEGTGIDLGNNRMKFADFYGATFNVGDFWKNGDALFFRVNNGGTPVNTELLFSRGVTTVAATSGTRKVAVMISGTLYYLLATP